MGKCIICGGHQKPFLHGTDFWLNTTYQNYEVIKCEICGLEKISPTPNFHEVSSFYKANYYSYEKAANVGRLSILRDKFFSIIHLLLGVNNKYFQITHYKEGHGKSFLDIGCGSGNIVKIMKGYGYSSDGFEIGPTGKIGDIYTNDSIISTDFGKKYDLIYISHVFEHVSDPVPFLKKVKELLNKNGKCIICLPDTNCLSSKLFKEFAMERDIPRHLYGYNFNNLEMLLGIIGFKIILKTKLRQYSFFDSFNLFIKKKYHLNLNNSFFGKGLRMFSTLVIENFLNLLKNTNQMGFIIQKK